MADTRAPLDLLVIGVDFGTTFSGIAATYGARPDAPDDINVVKTWPGGHGITSDKVPTEIAYASPAPVKKAGEGGLLGKATPQTGSKDPFNFVSLHDNLSKVDGAVGDGSAKWGYQITPEEQRIRCMKLLLDTRQPLPSYVSLADIKDQLTASGKDIASVVADFLSALYKHAKEMLARRYGDHFMETTKIKIVLTVPAVWSDAAKDATLRAARASGMGNNLTMISEPEAAAVYTLRAIQPNHLQAGHNFVVIDAGGGTVDLISYEIKQLQPLRVEESVPGSGSCCGAVLLNLRFEDYVRQKLGKSKFAEICASKPRTWLTALKYFEDYVKRNFDPEDDTTFSVPFPGVSDDADAGIESGFLWLTSQEVSEIFRPIVAEVLDLADGQVSKLKALGKSVNGLILVGGFGQSECLLKCLKNKFASAPGFLGRSSKLEVLQPVNAWTAVVRGAVLRGLEVEEVVTTRKARRHYGTQHNSPFVPLLHPESSKYWDDNEQKWKVRDRMSWYIKKGDSISSTEPILFPFYVIYADRDTINTMTFDLIACNEDVAPPGFQEGRNSTTKVVCKVKVDLKAVPARLWKNHTNAVGGRYRTLTYNLGMQVESGGIRFDCRIEGVVYGSVTAKFE